MSKDFPQQAKIELQGVRDPCSSVQVTSNFRVWSALRGLPLRGRYCALSTTLQKSSKGLTWYCCLWGRETIDFNHGVECGGMASPPPLATPHQATYIVLAK